jgi:hypothetical protein
LKGRVVCCVAAVDRRERNESLLADDDDAYEAFVPDYGKANSYERVLSLEGWSIIFDPEKF